MPRLARFTYPDAYYHVMTRGNNKQTVFKNESDYIYYKKILLEYKDKFKIKFFNYSLMTNHTHFILQSPIGTALSDMMKAINLKYALYFRRKYGGIGHFWQDRFKSFVIETGIYLLESARYVELNPVNAGIVQYPWEYRWSSSAFYVEGKEDELLDYNPEFMGLGCNLEQSRKEYKKFLIDGIRDKERREEERFFREGVYGSKEFIEKLHAKGLKSKWSHPGQPQKRNNKKN